MFSISKLIFFFHPPIGNANQPLSNVFSLQNSELLDYLIEATCPAHRNLCLSSLIKQDNQLYPSCSSFFRLLSSLHIFPNTQFHDIWHQFSSLEAQASLCSNAGRLIILSSFYLPPIIFEYKQFNFNLIRWILCCLYSQDDFQPYFLYVLLYIP
jgi:hypothetical protein